MLEELFVRGGPVLYLLFLLSGLIFYLLVDKYVFIFFKSKNFLISSVYDFSNEYSPSNTDYRFIQNTLISSVKREANKNIKILDGFIGMCPMIGLLGTVYGMIEVFEVLSFLGTGNPRAMSSGVAKATIPTMASMVITLFGLYFRQDLTSRIQNSNSDLKNLIKKRGYSYCDVKIEDYKKKLD